MLRTSVENGHVVHDVTYVLVKLVKVGVAVTRPDFLKDDVEIHLFEHDQLLTSSEAERTKVVQFLRL